MKKEEHGEDSTKDSADGKGMQSEKAERATAGRSEGEKESSSSMRKPGLKAAGEEDGMEMKKESDASNIAATQRKKEEADEGELVGLTVKCRNCGEGVDMGLIDAHSAKCESVVQKEREATEEQVSGEETIRCEPFQRLLKGEEGCRRERDRE